MKQLKVLKDFILPATSELARYPIGFGLTSSCSVM
jgi:hypothetical protein